MTKKGFSFIEIILIIGLMSLVGVATIPVAMNFYNKVAFEDVSAKFLFDFQKVRTNSSQKTLPWAIKVSQKEYEVFANATIDTTGVTGDSESITKLKGGTNFNVANNEKWIYSFDAKRRGNLVAWKSDGGDFSRQTKIKSCNLGLNSDKENTVYSMYFLGGSIKSDVCVGSCPVSAVCDPKDAVCGDGIKDSSNNEKCDDNNNVNGDGCDMNCQEEYGWSCDNNPWPSVCLAWCKFDVAKFDECAL